MTFEMTHQEASDLATLVEKLRRRLPGDPWHKPGIEDALARARHRASAPDLACAAIRAAEIPTNRTPAVIGMDGPHWREASKPPRVEPVNREERCSICGYSEPVCRIRHSVADHEFCVAVATDSKRTSTEATAAAVAALREGLPPMKPPTPPRTLDELAADNPRLHERVETVRASLPKPAPMQETETEEAVEA